MFKQTLFLLLAGALCGFAQTRAAVPELAAVDQIVQGVIAKYDIPGVAISVAKDGRLVYARGFGVADRETKEAVQPDSLFRVASVSKPLTAMAVLKLVEEGKVSLDTKVLSFVGRQATGDVRYGNITVRHLLQHSGGMDIQTWQVDPSFPDRKTLLALGVNLPPTRAQVLDFTIANFPLAFDPGAGYAYSNIGYMMLTEVIEKASGMAYEAYMKEKIFAPMGIVRMGIGGSLITERRAGEVRYWDRERMDESIFPGTDEKVLLPYGTFNLRIFESGGGWVASMPDLVRFLTAFDANSTYSFLRPETVRLINQRPASVAADAPYYNGLGWQILKTPLGERWDHDGALQGTSAWYFRGINGISVALAANTLPDDEVIVAFLTDISEGLFNALLGVEKWPTGNRFSTYFPGEAPRIADAGVVNAASLRPGPVAAGSVVKIFGVNLKGGSVRVNGAVLNTLWQADGELYVQVPRNASGATRFEVFNNGVSSNTVTVDVTNDAPGLFTRSGNGYGQAACFNQDGSVNTPETPARAGSIVTLIVTGTSQPAVLVGGKPAAVLFTGQTIGLSAGMVQVAVRLPSDLPAGKLPVLIQAGGATSQAGATIAVR
jgi:uncharacterized protein (TIGR03437 family)